jgi:hypothetical protein
MGCAICLASRRGILCNCAQSRSIMSSGCLRGTTRPKRETSAPCARRASSASLRAANTCFAPSVDGSLLWGNLGSRAANERVRDVSVSPSSPSGEERKSTSVRTRWRGGDGLARAAPVISVSRSEARVKRSTASSDRIFTSNAPADIKVPLCMADARSAEPTNFLCLWLLRSKSPLDFPEITCLHVTYIRNIRPRSSSFTRSDPPKKPLG